MRAKNSKLDSRETAICLRLVEARADLRLDQMAFGSVAGISRDRVASYENLRAPLRYPIADRLCCAFNINQRWMATGEVPKFHYVHIPKQVSRTIPGRMLFSEAYHTKLAAFIEERLKFEAFSLGLTVEGLGNRPQALPKSLRDEIAKYVHNSDALYPHLIASIRRAYEQLPNELRLKFFKQITKAVANFLDTDHHEDA
jgi:transcriptional regulator with XRE-family HTH domain